MSEHTERSEAHERMPKEGEGHEQATSTGDVAAPEPKPPARPGRRADSRGTPRPHRPPNALGPFIPVDTE